MKISRSRRAYAIDSIRPVRENVHPEWWPWDDRGWQELTQNLAGYKKEAAETRWTVH